MKHQVLSLQNCLKKLVQKAQMSPIPYVQLQLATRGCSHGFELVTGMNNFLDEVKDPCMWWLTAKFGASLSDTEHHAPGAHSTRSWLKKPLQE